MDEMNITSTEGRDVRRKKELRLIEELKKRGDKGGYKRE